MDSLLYHWRDRWPPYNYAFQYSTLHRQILGATNYHFLQRHIMRSVNIDFRCPHRRQGIRYKIFGGMDVIVIRDRLKIDQNNDVIFSTEY